MSGPPDAGLGHGHLVSTAPRDPSRPLKVENSGRTTADWQPFPQATSPGRGVEHIRQVLLCFRTRFGFLLIGLWVWCG